MKRNDLDPPPFLSPCRMNTKVSPVCVYHVIPRGAPTEGGGGGREVFLQSILSKRTVHVACAHTALYFLFSGRTVSQSSTSGADPAPSLQKAWGNSPQTAPGPCSKKFELTDAQSPRFSPCRTRTESKHQPTLKTGRKVDTVVGAHEVALPCIRRHDAS